MKLLIAFTALVFSPYLMAQDVAVLMKEAANLERSFKEDEALEKYKLVLQSEPNQLKALVRCSELAGNIGGRVADKKQKQDWYTTSITYAEQALAIDSVSAEALYARALAADRVSEVETDNKKLAVALREMKKYADKGIALYPGNGKSNFILGKWHYNLVMMPWAKKAALKVFFGGMPDGDWDSAYVHMEKCRAAEPYFMKNFYYLARAYKANDKPSKAIEILEQLAKLPTRQLDDVTLKADGKNLLAEMQ